MNFEALDGYHDSELRSIDTGTIPHGVSLVFKLGDGRRRTLLLHSCEIFKVTDFVSQNVVSRLLLFRGEGIDAMDVANKLKWASSLSDSTSVLTEEKLGGIIDRIKSANASMLFLEPSWGAELVALFGKMEEVIVSREMV